MIMSIDDLPARLAELDRLLSLRHPKWQRCFCVARYTCATCGAVRVHRIIISEPGSEKEFDGKIFGDAYRAAYEFARQPLIA